MTYTQSMELQINSLSRLGSSLVCYQLLQRTCRSYLATGHATDDGPVAPVGRYGTMLGIVIRANRNLQIWIEKLNRWHLLPHEFIHNALLARLL